jgi:protein phosphatase
MTSLKNHMHVESGVSSSAGRKRTRNEDFHVSDNALGLFLVIDGMGGHARGDVASQIVGETIHKFIKDTANDRDKTWPFEFDPQLSFNANRMKAAVAMANQHLARRIHEDEQLRGMGATMAGALVDGDSAIVSNVGDCRTYLIRGGNITQLTADHSWVAEQVRSGLIQQGDARTHPLRNLVTRAVSGGDEPVDVDVHELPVQPKDQLLVCSDGLHGLLSDEEMLDEVKAHADDPQAACDSLVALANERGAPDNVTVVIVQVAD